MKNFIFLSALLLSLDSCTNVSFVESQPEFLEELTEIPERYQGSFVFKATPSNIDEDINIITATTINGISIISDSIVVKSRGNYFYVNLLDDNGNYELYVFKQNSFVNYEKIYANFPKIKKDKLHLFNVVDSRDCNFNKHCYLLDEVSVNQFNLLVNSSFMEEQVELERLD